MRLLLLLSALLSALTGVVGTRATAQPVQASASAIVVAGRVTGASRIAQRFAVPPYAGLPPLRLASPPLAASRLVGADASRLLYAGRRRE